MKNVLDRNPLNMISEADVWKSEDLVRIYLVALYDNMPFGFDRNGYIYEAHMTDESSHPYAGVLIVSDYGNQTLSLNTGMYTWIRRANYFLDKIKTSTIGADKIKSLTAEVRYIRAYYYFDLVKKYGGVPIVDAVQNFTGDNLSELQVSRNTEDEVYSFILSELNAAIADLPDSWDDANNNRATIMIAQALKSRAMLYAGSIAKYGTVQLNGLIGIADSKANTYFAESINASTAIMQSGKFELYNKLYDPNTKTGDPAENYRNLFLDKSNKEVILQKAYSNPDKTHAWDNYNMPQSFKPGCCGNACTPTLEMVESYEYTDGSAGTLNYVGLEFDAPVDLFKNKDPRFFGSYMYPECPFVGRNVQIYAGIYDVDGTLYNSSGTAFPPDPSRLQQGRDGPWVLGDVGKTGFYIRKYLNTSVIVPENTSDQNYIECRYAEILLNYAEAAVESGTNLPDALTSINLVRNRAGIRPLIASELTIDRIRNERKVELAFEDKRFWDIRRWRIGPDLFKNTYIHGLWPYLKYYGADKYTWTFVSHSGAPLDAGLSRVWVERDNYSNLSGYISSNKNIVNNPGW